MSGLQHPSGNSIAPRAARRTLLFVLPLLVLLNGCQRKAAGPPPRYAVVRFENLTGDATLDWAARAASEVLSRSLDGALDGPMLTAPVLNRAGNGLGAAPGNVPGNSTERAKAELAGANRLITGYFERVNGALRFSASEEDLSSHKTARMFSAEDAQPFAAMRRLAQTFSASARPYLTSNADTLRLYVSALEAPPDQAMADLRQATSSDPAFGPAWVALIDLYVSRGDRSSSLDAANSALSHKLDPADQASVSLQKALLTNDKPARMAALRALNAASPADLNLLRNLAENELAAGDFTAASTHWKQLRDALPYDQNAWNQLGYALAWSGNYSAAIQALKEYATRWPTNPNPLDSQADVDYLYGKFADAAANYLKANEKDPQFLAGGELYKAAWAQFRAGDKAKANATFAQFKAVRTKTEAAGFVLTEADWLYRTGRADQATALLRKEAPTAQPAIASQFYSQLVIWDLLAKDRTTAQKDAAIEATKPPSNVSTVARFAALPSASPEEWRKRADTLLNGAGVDAARRFALGAALILDGKKDAAIPVWDEIVKEDSSTDFYARTIAAKLKGQKPPFELLPDPTSVNQLRALPDSL